MNGMMLANRRKDSAESDFYPTPPDVTRALLPFLPRRVRVWEPACGNGAMAAVLADAGHEVIATDLYDRGFGTSGRDFLTAEPPTEYDWIITNPPFRLADAFVRRAVSFQKPVALLLKSQFWHAEKRRNLFYLHPPIYVLPLTWRPSFTGGTAPTMECLWTIWSPRPPGLPTEYKPLARPR